jgi:hypothetical protein
MALQLNDRVKESSITTGVAPIVLTGASTGYQNVASSISTSNTFPYVVELVGGSEWEIGIGQYVSSNNSIIRTQILNSSNSSNIVNFSAGTKNVFISVPAVYMALTASGLSQFSSTTSAELASIISDETGSGKLVFSNNAILVTPDIGRANGTSLTLSGDLSVTGNVYLSGNVTTLSSNNLSINDSLIYLAQDNPANLQDIGIVGHFTTDHYQHTGFVRDASDGVWKLFSNVSSEPTTTIDFTGAIYDTIQVGSVNTSNAIFSTANGSAPFTVVSNTLVSNLNADLLDGQHGTYYTGLTSSAFNQANSAYTTANTGVFIGQGAFTQANAAYMQANTSLIVGQSAFSQANAAYNKANTVTSGLTPTSIQTANYTAAVNDLVRCNTAAGAFSVTFPASPVDGSIIGVVDIAETFNNYNLTILPNGKNIESDSTSLALDMNGTYVSFIYNSSTSNWRLLETPVGTLTSSSLKTITNISNAYTIILSDLGKIINCTANTFTVGLTAAASLGSGFTCTIWNTGSGAITIDPNASETIDGVATLILRQGEGLAIVCNGTNWETDNKKPMRGYAENLVSTAVRPVASGDKAVAIMQQSTASGAGALAIGYGATASAQGAIAIGYGTPVASSTYSTAIGSASLGYASQAVTGAGAMALGGSYASGADSFAAAIGDNTSSYGATGANSIAIGYQNKSSGQYGVSLGYFNISSGSASFTVGLGNTASGEYSAAFGRYSRAAQSGKYAFGSAQNASWAQGGKIVLSAATTTTTAVVLTSDGSTASTTNQLIIATNQAMTFWGTLIAKQSASANMASYMFKGAIVNNGGTVSISSISLDTIVDTIGLGAVPTFTADNTNKALAVTSGYKSATNIRWVCNIDSVELTYA